MNKRMIVWLLGALLLIESGLMLLPLVTALLYRERDRSLISSTRSSARASPAG